MQNINPDTLLKCHLNGTDITDENILHFLCPDDRYRPWLNKEPRLNKVVFFSCNWPCLTKVPCLNKEPCLNRATLFKPCYLG